jgi:hypothetical protein
VKFSVERDIIDFVWIMRIFENRVLRMFGPKREGVRGG